MNATIEIKSISGSTILTAIVTESAISHEELMTSDYVQLSWNSGTGDTIPAGAYIEHEGERYSLLEPYSPSRTDEAEYQYTPQFQSRIMSWQKHPVPLYTYNTDGTTVNTREFDWEFTGSPADAMYMVQQAIKNETGEQWSVQLADILPATISISSQSSSIFSVLTDIANQCGTEWWADKSTNTLYLSQCKHGTPFTLTVGENVKAPTVTANKDGYFTRFYVFGSSRNVTQDAAQGAATNSIVNKRLTLDPSTYPEGYIDVRPNLQPGEIFTTILYYNEIYPSAKLAISDVRARLKYRLDSSGNRIQTGTDDDGNPVYEQYAIWYFQITNFDFNPDTIIEGMNLSVSFKSGQLAGRDFELTYHEKAEKVNDNSSDVVPFNIMAGDYEIILDESTGMIIPGMSYIIPQDGDQVILYNIEMPAEYTAFARQELAQTAQADIAKRTADNNSYEMDSNPVDFYENGTDLTLGQAVTFVNGSTSLSTRVLMVEKHLDYSFQQRIRVGNEIIKGNTQQLKEEVTQASQNIDILAAFNELSTSLQNTYGKYQREMTAWVAAMQGMWQFDPNDPNTIYSKYNVYNQGWLSTIGKNPDSGGEVTGATTLGGLTNVGPWADSTASADRIMVQLKGSSSWTSKPLSEVVGLDEKALDEYLTANRYATQSWVTSQGYATTDDLDARIDALVSGAPAAFDTLKEIADVLQGNVDSIGDILTTLGKKADKAVTITAGTGLTGGGDLSANRTLSLATVGTAGTYTKVTVDAYGRVTGHASLVAGDIPALSISKITGLQSALDKKLDAATFDDLFEKVEISTGVYAIRAKYGLYSDDWVSVMGANPDAGGTSSGVTELSKLSDVSLGTLVNGQALVYDSTSQKWVNRTIESGLDTEELAAYLTENNYATQSWVTGQGYLKSVSLSTISDLHSSWDALLKAAPSAYVTRWPTAAEVGALTQATADGRYVTLSTKQTISGEKTFNNIILSNYDIRLPQPNTYIRYTTAAILGYNSGRDCILFGNIGYTAELRGKGNTPYYVYSSELTRVPILTSENYTTYTVTKTGGGASGTWPISISGNASTASKWATARTITLTGAVTGSVSIDGSGNVSMATTYATGNISALDSRYVNVSGDTMTGRLLVPSVVATSNTVLLGDTSYTNGRLLYSDGTFYIQSSASGKMILAGRNMTRLTDFNIQVSSHSVATINDSVIWTAGNDGAGSGLDADLLDGYHASSFVKNLNPGASVNANNATQNALTHEYRWTNTPVNDIASLLDLTYSPDWRTQLFVYHQATPSIRVRSRYSGTTWGSWFTLAYTSSNVASATKLQTARNLWGQSFNGTANVSGNMTGVGSISASGDITCSSVYTSSWFRSTGQTGWYSQTYGGGWYMTDSTWIRTYNNKSVYQNTGQIRTDGYLVTKGGLTVGATSTNNGTYKVHCTGAMYASVGVVSDGYVSAKGANTSSDIRLKTKLSDITLSPKDIANAPSMLFAWKQNGLKDVGSSAQYWKNILPDAVKERDGWLEMAYGNIALVSAISLAKHVVNHEERIRQLENENRQLKEKIAMMERRAAWAA